MIIGNGLLATAFEEYKHTKGITIFASGVSNSQETNSAAFEREVNLLLTAQELAPRGKLFIYFSTCSIYERIHSPYVYHKLHMETLVNRYNPHMIIRLPQIASYSANPHTLLNFLYNKVQTGEPFELWGNTTRYVIGIDDIVKTVRKLIANPQRFVSLTTYPTTPQIIVNKFEQILNRKAKYILTLRGRPYENHGIHVDTNINDTLAKYYTTELRDVA